MADEEKKIAEKKDVVGMGLPKNTANTLCYASGFLPYVGWLTGLLMLFFEKDKDVRFHSLQAISFFGLVSVIQVVSKSSFLFSQLWSLSLVVQFIVWLMLTYRTYHGEKWVLPVVGKWSEEQIEKMR